VLLVFLLAYGAASLFHHVHNALHLDEYPNLPAWLTRVQVYAAWLGVTAVGLIGYVLIRWQHQITGLLVLGFYGALGFDGLGHYAVAPLSAHAFAMNVSIGLEVATALLLLAAVTSLLLQKLRQNRKATHR
jgi:hypothetical protein